MDAYETGRGVYDLAARQSRNRNYCRSAENFLLAARHFARAGDKTAAENAMFQAGLVQADCKDQKERAVKAATVKASTPKEAQRSGSCVAYFQNMRKLFRDNAAVCLKETRLLQSLVDKVGQSASGDPSFTRASAPELFAILDPSDPGWTLSATRASPKCGVPLRVDAQNDAFSECARVYLCGAAAASCGLRRARETNSSDCIPISHACLAPAPRAPAWQRKPAGPEFLGAADYRHPVRAARACAQKHNNRTVEPWQQCWSAGHHDHRAMKQAELLLAGAILGFLALTIVMFVTLRANWSGSPARQMPG